MSGKLVLLINIKMPKAVGILIFITMTNFTRSSSKRKKFNFMASYIYISTRPISRSAELSMVNVLQPLGLVESFIILPWRCTVTTSRRKSMLFWGLSYNIIDSRFSETWLLRFSRRPALHLCFTYTFRKSPDFVQKAVTPICKSRWLPIRHFGKFRHSRIQPVSEYFEYTGCNDIT